MSGLTLIVYWAFYYYLLLLQFTRGEQSPLEHCEEAQEWPLNGRTLVRDYRGRILLMTFISLKNCNAECELTLSRLDSLHDQFPSVRVLAIAPRDLPAAEVRAFAWRFPRIRFEHEHKKSPVWDWFRAAHLDQFIFDRCSRNFSKLSTPGNSIPPLYAATVHLLREVISSQPCGPCEYDWAKSAPKWPSLHPPLPPQKKIENSKIAYSKKATPKTQVVVVNTGGLMTAFSTEIGSPKDGIGAKKQLAFAEQRAVGSNHGSRKEKHLPYGGQQRQAVPVHSYPAAQQHQQSQRQTGPQLTQLEQQREELARIQQQQMERERMLREHEERLRQRQKMEEEQRRRYWAEQQERQRHQQNFDRFSPSAPPIAQQENRKILPAQTLPQQNRQSQQPAPIQYKNDPYGDRYRFGLGRTHTDDQMGRQQRVQRPVHQTPAIPEQHQQVAPPPINSPQQIVNQPQVSAPTPAPDEPAPLYPEGSENDYYGYDDEWTTETPSMLQIPKPTKQTTPTTPSIQQDKNFGFELPCTGFSDESCFQQQTQLRPNEVHRCCRGRILFSDQCVQGKCSNMTTQLCCIQRFLQAKLTCCSDERQAETGVGDHFSRCCFDNFVDSDDPCCPREYASEQWRSVHELCLPNVEMDLRDVKVPVPLMGTSLITEFDFAKTDKWRFECRYGGHVQQYSFFEQSASEEEGENEGGGEIDD